MHLQMTTQTDVNQKLKFVSVRGENMAKGENAHYQHFLLFPQCFQKASYTASIKVVIVLSRVNNTMRKRPHKTIPPFPSFSPVKD